MEEGEEANILTAQAEASAVAQEAVTEDLERNYAECVKERDNLREQFEAAQSTISVLQAQTITQNSVELEKRKTKAAREQLQNEKERLDRMQIEGDALRREIRYDISASRGKELT